MRWRSALLRRFRALVAAALFGCCIGGLVADSKGQAATPPWRVVVLNSVDVFTPLCLAVEPILRQAIADAAAPRSVEFVGEALDLGRFPELEADQRSLLARKYATLPADLV